MLGNQLRIELVLFALNRLEGLCEVLSHTKVVSLDAVAEVGVSAVQLLKLSVFSQLTDLLVSKDKNLCFLDGQVERQFTVGLDKVVLDALTKELNGVLLNLVEVGKLEFTHGEASGHAELPLDLVYNSQRECFSYRERMAHSQPCSTAPCRGFATEGAQSIISTIIDIKEILIN